MALPSSSPTAAATTPDRASPSCRVLAISDVVEPLIYNNHIRERFKHVDLVLSCGDLPATYLEFIVSSLNVPLYGVRGNHDYGGSFDHSPPDSLAPGTGDLHRRVVEVDGLLIAGLEGSMEYNNGPHQYTEAGMRFEIARLTPRLLLNKLRYGRYLDVLITHAPPQGIHDQPDRCHQGFAVFRPFLRFFRPRYHLHGHIHVYNLQHTTIKTRFHDTTVLNAYGYRELRLVVPSGNAALSTSEMRG